MATQNVFVTGGTGLVGKAVVKRLLAASTSLTVLLREASRERRAIDIETLESLAAHQFFQFPLSSPWLSR